MAQYFNDFSQYTVEQFPGDWTIRGTATGNTLAVIEDPSLPGNKILRHTSNGRDNNNTPVTWDVIDADDNRGHINILARVRTDLLGNGLANGLVVRNDGYDGYVGFARDVSPNIQIGDMSSNANPPVLASTGKALPTNEWFYLEMQAVGDEISLRGWTGDIDDRPEEWDLTVTNSRLTTGGAGIFMRWRNPTMDWDWVGIGTNGDPAPTGPVDDGVDVSITATELGHDVASVGISNAIQLGISAGETGQDSAALTLDNHINLSITAIESGSDTATIQIQTDDSISLTISAFESGNDSASVALNNPIGVEVVAQESGYDTASITLDVSQDVNISITAQEQGADTAQIIIIAGQIYVIPAGCASIEDVSPVYSIEDVSPLYSIEDVTCQLV